jgi:nitrate reductase (NAD(P)H)
MGNYLDTMTEGEELDIKGPLGEIEYKGKGDFLISGKEYHFDRVRLPRVPICVLPNFPSI